MSCATCARRVEQAIGKLEGIVNVSVNFATEKATIDYDPQKVRVSLIRETIEKAGYKVLENNPSHDDKQKEIKILWIKFIVSAVFAIPLLYIAMAPMMKLPEIINHADYPLLIALVELALLFPLFLSDINFIQLVFIPL